MTDIQTHPTQLASTDFQQPKFSLNYQQRRWLGYIIRYIIAAILIVFAFVPVVFRKLSRRRTSCQKNKHS